MDGPPPTNDLIASLVSRLSPEALEVLRRVEAMAKDAPEDEGMDRAGAQRLVETLPTEERLTVARILDLRSQAWAEVADGIQADLERLNEHPQD